MNQYPANSRFARDAPDFRFRDPSGVGGRDGADSMPEATLPDLVEGEFGMRFKLTRDDGN